MTLQADEPLTSSPLPVPPEPTVYKVGTLIYTSRGLVVLFLWMLFGDFCFSMMENIVPTMVPLLLAKQLDSKTLIALVVGVIPNLIIAIVTPILSYRSDRHRGRRGRRIPYLITFSPIVAACVILAGFSLDIGHWFHGVLSGRYPRISSTHVLSVTIAVCSTLFQFFNVFVYTIYYYLFNDVIPATLLGRFYALFRIVGAASGFLFSRYVLGWAEHHMRTIFVAIALVYLIAFMLMCWKVREGEYPPPPEVPQRKTTGRLRQWFLSVQTFVRECYAQPFYWPLYLGYAFLLLGGCGISLFRLVFAHEELKMSLDEFGRTISWGSVISLVLYYPLGWLADCIHPMRLLLIAIAAVLVVFLGSAMGIRSKESFVFWTLASYVPQAMAVSANAPLYPRILPKSRFGQFSSAIALLSQIAVVLGNLAVGIVLDDASSYMMMYWWGTLFTALSLICYAGLYIGWQRRGGTAHFVPPV